MVAVGSSTDATTRDPTDANPRVGLARIAVCDEYRSVLQPPHEDHWWTSLRRSPEDAAIGYPFDRYAGGVPCRNEASPANQ